MANHESFVDILLISHLPFEMKWLSKAEFFKFPLVGWLMKMAGDIPLDRSSGRSAVKALKQCRVMLDRRVSVIIFPEGTRSESGELQEFKDGAFRLAVDAGVPIIPLAVHGTKTALRKHDWRYGRARAEVRILEPVSTEGLTNARCPSPARPSPRPHRHRVADDEHRERPRLIPRFLCLCHRHRRGSPVAVTQTVEIQPQPRVRAVSDRGTSARSAGNVPSTRSPRFDVTPSQ